MQLLYEVHPFDRFFNLSYTYWHSCIEKTDRSDEQALCKIYAFLEVIRGIAKKTNLLALNAFLEAAREVQKVLPGKSGYCGG